MKTLTEGELFKQTSLTPGRLKKYLTPKEPFNPSSTRPESSFVDLINWVAYEFDLDPQKYGSYIHNKMQT